MNRRARTIAILATATVASACGGHHHAAAPILLEPPLPDCHQTGSCEELDKFMVPPDHADDGAFAASGFDWSTPPTPAADPPYTPPAPITFTVAGGVRVILVENHRLPLVSFRVAETRAGSREDGAQLGLAALVADLLDEGAGSLDARTLPEALERLGATLDTGVSADASLISLDTMTETLAPSVGLLADVLARPRFAAGDVARVKGDRLEELALRPDEPRLIGSIAFEKLVFGAHPYAQPADGFTRTVKPITAKQVRAFWAAHYGPATTTIVVAGDVDRATLTALLDHALARWHGGPTAAATPPPAPIAAAPTLAFIDRPGAPQSVVWIGRLGATTAAPDYYAQEVINTALGGSFASRLNARLRETLGYTYGVGSTFWRGAWAGSWAITTSLITAHTADGIREALAIVGEARAHPLPAAELAKTQAFLARSMPQAFETNAGIAGELLDLALDDRPLDWHQRLVAGLERVTAEDARTAAANAWGELTIVVVGDWAAVGKDLAQFELPIVHLDAEGNPAK